MEEKILVQSQQYDIKKIVKRLSCLIIILSFFVSALMCWTFYTRAVDEVRYNYENYYLPNYEERVEEYNDILKRYESKDEMKIYCDHAEYTTKLYYGSGKYNTYKEPIPMEKSKFMETHPTAYSYISCRYSDVYENFDEYKEARLGEEFGYYEKSTSSLPLLANILIPIIFLIYLWLRSYSLTITDKRVYGKTAFGKRVDLPFDSVSSVGTSALKGVAVGTSSGKINFKLIKNQSEIHSVISTLLAERQNVEKKTTEATVNQTIVENSNADELKKFKELLDSGVISQEEFDAKKKQLLNL